MELTPTLILNLVLLIVPPVALVLVFRQWLARHIRQTVALGAKRKQINRTLFTQTAVFFAIPLTVAGIYSDFLIGKAMTVVEEFMNIHISTNIGLTIILFLMVYGGYFLATYLSCKRIVTEQKKLEV